MEEGRTVAGKGEGKKGRGGKEEVSSAELEGNGNELEEVGERIKGWEKGEWVEGALRVRRKVVEIY